MTEQQNLELIQLVLVAVLVGSALVSRRLPIGHMMRLALAWLAIFSVTFYVVAQRDRIANAVAALGARLGISDTRASADGKATEIARAADGHFWADAMLNGRHVRMMIDSGATTTSISSKVLAEIGAKPDDGFPQMIETANGSMLAKRTRIASLVIGNVTLDNVAAMTSDQFGDTNVIGMNVLDTLTSWTVKGDNMVLVP